MGMDATCTIGYGFVVDRHETHVDWADEFDLTLFEYSTGIVRSEHWRGSSIRKKEQAT